MISMRRTAAWGAALLASVTAATLTAVPAQADGPRWRVVETRPDLASTHYRTVVTSSRHNAWAFGGDHGGDGPLRPIAKRWVGGAWHDVDLPESVIGQIDAASMTSARNLWAVADYGDMGPSYVLRWDGKAWSVSHQWEDGLTSDVITTGRRDVWVFGSSRAGDGVGTWHFDGRRWSHVDLGDLLLGSGSALSARNIWAVGRDRSTGCGDRTVAHYDGKTWRAVPVGDALPPDIWPPSEDGADQCVYLNDVLAKSARDVWVTGRVAWSDGGDHDDERPLLVHWDGRTWRREDIPGNWNPVTLASDGRGGLWIRGLNGFDDPTPLMHRSANGTWRTVTIDNPAGRGPAKVNDLALIPGTRSLWGVGEIPTPEGRNAAIYRYR